MLKIYSEEWRGFQFRAPLYLDGHFEPFEFDLIKWFDCEPHEVVNLASGKKEMLSRYNISIGKLTWNPKEPQFEFQSVGLRYFEHRTDGLEDFILDFCNKMEQFLQKEDE